MKSFEITWKSSGSLWIEVQDCTGLYLRVVVRENRTGSELVFDKWSPGVVGSLIGYDFFVDGLMPDTDYLINVGYSTEKFSNVTWIGAQEFRTNPETTIPYYKVDYVGTNRVVAGLRFNGNAGRWYVGKIRLKNSSATLYEEWHYFDDTWGGGTYSFNFTELTHNTEYVVNIGYSNVEHGSVTWLGEREATTALDKYLTTDYLFFDEDNSAFGVSGGFVAIGISQEAFFPGNYQYIRVYVRDGNGTVYHDEVIREYQLRYPFTSVMVVGLNPNVQYFINIYASHEYSGSNGAWLYNSSNLPTLTSSALTLSSISVSSTGQTSVYLDAETIRDDTQLKFSINGNTYTINPQAGETFYYNFIKNVTGLSAGTEYFWSAELFCNGLFQSSYEGTVTTDKASGQATVYVNDGTGPKRSIPYVFDGVSWKKAKVYIS